MDVIQERVDLLPVPRTPWERHVPEENQSTILIPIASASASLLVCFYCLRVQPLRLREVSL